MKLNIVKFKSVKSTNDEAINLIKKKKKYFGVVVSKEQTKGRGSMGKKWISEKGNLFISIFFKVNLEKYKIKDFLLLNVNLVRKILAEFSKNPITVKLPNDLLIDGKKLCGILQETIEHKNDKYLITGIGINSLKAIVNKEFKATSIKNNSDQNINNHLILKKIIKCYEEVIIDLKNYNLKFIKNKYIN